MCWAASMPGAGWGGGAEVWRSRCEAARCGETTSDLAVRQQRLEAIEKRALCLDHDRPRLREREELADVVLLIVGEAVAARVDLRLALGRHAGQEAVHDL